MHIQSNAPMSGLLELHRTRAAEAGGGNGTQEHGRSGQGDDALPPIGDVSSAPSSALLTSQTLGGLLARGQQDGEASAPPGVRDQMARIAHDDRYAAEQAGAFAHGTRAVCMKPPANGAPASEWQAFSQTVTDAREQLDRIQAQKIDLYERETANGTPAAEVYAHMLELELAQPQSYWAAMDPAGQLGDLRGNVQAHLDALRGVMASPRQSSV